MFTADAKSYSIDLTRNQSDRWAEVIAQEREVARPLVAEANEQYEHVPEPLRQIFARVYQASGGLYQGEMRAWAQGLDVSVGTMTMLNCLYELSHLRLPKIFGCTAGVRWLDGGGMVHVRTLDWPLECMGPATRLFRFHNGAREFVSVGVPGQVGVLSAMVPGKYSITLNWAPPQSMLPSWDFGTTFCLRDALENCDTYNSAVETLRTTRLSTSVFFTVCGTEKGQGCIIERTRDDAAVRRFDGANALIQANHHLADRFVKNNEDIRDQPPELEVFSLHGSNRRMNILGEALNHLPASATLDEAGEVLNIPTVLNDQTCQQIVFCPRSGETRVWRRISA